MKETLPPPAQPITLPAQTRVLRLRVPPAADKAWCEEVMDLASDAGFNAVIVDAFFGGLSLARRSPRAMRVLGRIARPHDLMSCLCDAAQSNDLFLYAGMDLLYLGIQGRYPRSPLVNNKKLIARNERQLPLTLPDTTDDHPIFLCPAKEEVWNMLGTLAKELAAAYPIEGFYFDHIALPPGLTCDCTKKIINPSPAPNELSVGEESGENQLPPVPDSDYSDVTSRMLYAIRLHIHQVRRSSIICGHLPPGTAMEEDPVAEGLLDIRVCSDAEFREGGLGALPSQILFEKTDLSPTEQQNLLLEDWSYGTIWTLPAEKAARMDIPEFPEADTAPIPPPVETELLPMALFLMDSLASHDDLARHRRYRIAQAATQLRGSGKQRTKVRGEKPADGPPRWNPWSCLPSLTWFDDTVKELKEALNEEADLNPSIQALFSRTIAVLRLLQRT